MRTASDPVAELVDDLETLRRAYPLGHHGVWAARRRADLVDGTLRELFERSGAPPGTALAAVGGYGRGLLLPRSDVDMLLLHDGSDPSGVAATIDQLLYPLWDGGFDVGHAVRTPTECLAACERLDAAASMLDLRHLAGDGRLTDDAADRVLGWARADVDAFVRAIDDDASRRADRHGSTAHLLEPDLKDGSGGWRDLHSIWLIDRVAGEVVRGREREALAAAEEFIARVRSALHLVTRRRGDDLVLDHQPEIATALGFVDEPGLLSTDGMMRALFRHARLVGFVLAAVIERALGDDEGTVEVDPTAAGVLEALAGVAGQGRRPSGSLLDAIDAAEIHDDVGWDARSLEAFFRLLEAGDAGVAGLEALDRLGLLERLLPGWSDVRCRPQRDPYHRFTVDSHLTGTLREMGAILAGEGAEGDPVQREALALVGDPRGLLLGALLHDVGKVGVGTHVPVGVRVATSILDRIGVTDPTRALVLALVEHHLVLPDTATRRDLTDENLILDVAATVGTADRLAALYLLAKADALATGPAAWTPWRQTLIRELVAKVQHVLERGDMGAELAERLATRTRELRGRLAGEPSPDVDRFLEAMPRAYLLSVEPERAARHFATIAPPVGALEVRAVDHQGVRPGTYELLVVARDRPGLLSWIAGSLALAGLSILTAQVFTTEDGVAADLFEVEGVWEPEVPERRWREFRQTLRRAVDGSISLDRRVDEKRRWYPAPKAPAPLTVAVDDRASDFSTVIEVGGPDRLGLLYDITRTFADLGLDVHLAKVATYEGRVVDSFYVRAPGGGKVPAGDHAAIERALRARLDPDRQPPDRDADGGGA
jgi:[protein-PII] uridylyltransferase